MNFDLELFQKSANYLNRGGNMSKGKITKDIYLRVGHAIMRIPRENDTTTQTQQSTFSQTKQTKKKGKRSYSTSNRT